MKVLAAIFLVAASVSAQTATTPATVWAKALGPAPGTIVCQNLQTVSVMFDLYAESLEERMQHVLTGGKSDMVNGSPMPPPDPGRHGCVLNKPGTPMKLVSIDPVFKFATMIVKTPTGRTFRGVTQPNMYATYRQTSAGDRR